MELKQLTTAKLQQIKLCGQGIMNSTTVVITSDQDAEQEFHHFPLTVLQSIQSLFCI